MNIAKWHVNTKKALEQEYMLNLKKFLIQEKHKRKVIFPHSKNWFKAFELTPFAKVKVVILGQDPYHNINQAHGLSFSVPKGVKTPPSLENIYKELHSDLNLIPQPTGDLTAWATQGVLLLNSILTVERHAPGSHAHSGWAIFTDMVIKTLSTQKENLIFMLWGAYAQKKAQLINQHKHLILKAAHPSPFSAHKGFFGCGHFSKANQHLSATGQSPINWQL